MPFALEPLKALARLEGGAAPRIWPGLEPEKRRAAVNIKKEGDGTMRHGIMELRVL